ncbi:hypothetical protein BD779DRAFT_948135 [Infundibulicybe gibba]|nr:hypothetical protein BD779DRAFT_948135 [Infundibulicybe gibba]
MGAFRTPKTSGRHKGHYCHPCSPRRARPTPLELSGENHRNAVRVNKFIGAGEMVRSCTACRARSGGTSVELECAKRSAWVAERQSLSSGVSQISSTCSTGSVIIIYRIFPVARIPRRVRAESGNLSRTVGLFISDSSSDHLSSCDLDRN